MNQTSFTTNIFSLNPYVQDPKIHFYESLAFISLYAVQIIHFSKIRIDQRPAIQQKRKYIKYTIFDIISRPYPIGPPNT